ncbi:hypothetical protein GOEFS_066_00050 [Gordonia effusa NBRC 100432]|uniref:ER-bound oxygenase mpaB/mpaB'/Rubber oxygenase catalytic domain-containing protein n=1 Tax=Gordonia effusa NBRC 100432 TaxID=1077974 RepID=H0R180_9ACTN|nr:oxygenase MpaB family protein [Gordonia effusa]GAB18831.1 hypothetical protein GOEFS_066_00050 [Gordonia effusa NBRC 100432]
MTAEALDRPQATPDSSEKQVPRVSRAELDAVRTDQMPMIGIALLAGPANVIMQLAMPAVGYGVVESRVESGNLLKHPVKRTRTTLSYLAVAALGSPEDRKAYRKAVGKSHAQVHSTESSPVKYNAFDPKLQLWVAACLYRGWEDMQRIYGDPATITEEAYQQGSVMGTTLQVPREMWPATREDFWKYWDDTVATLKIDPPVQRYLRGLARVEFMGKTPSRLFGWWSEIFAIGFLPTEFRTMMDMQLSPAQERVFHVHNKILGAIVRRLPRSLQLFPFNILLADVRWRIRTGRSLV